jgi:hypothetical protein
MAGMAVPGISLLEEKQQKGSKCCLYDGLF